MSMNVIYLPMMAGLALHVLLCTISFSPRSPVTQYKDLCVCYALRCHVSRSHHFRIMWQNLGLQRKMRVSKIVHIGPHSSADNLMKSTLIHERTKTTKHCENSTRPCTYKAANAKIWETHAVWNPKEKRCVTSVTDLFGKCHAIHISH